MNATLTSSEMARYARQTQVPGFGLEGQQKLRNAKVLMIGLGALGSPAAIHLAAAGVGQLTIVDPDVVDVTNLHRQPLHGESWIGQPKVESAAARLAETNPHVRIVIHRCKFTPDNAKSIATGHHVIVDGSDNFATRYLANDTAYHHGIPLVHGAVHRFEGRLSVFAPHLGGPCFRCLLPRIPPPNSIPVCAESGVLGMVPGIIGTMQALEVLKLLTNLGDVVHGRVLIHDALQNTMHSIRLRRDPECRLCGSGQPAITTLANEETLIESACNPFPGIGEIHAADLREWIGRGGDDMPFLIDVREDSERAVCQIEGSLHFPMSRFSDWIDQVPRDRRIVLYCQSGLRSERCATMLSTAGFSDISHLKGGILAWLSHEDVME